MDYTIWQEMYGNGAVTGTGLTITRPLQKIKYQLIRKVPRIHSIRRNPDKKRKCKGADLFYVQISIVPVIWLEAGERENSVLLQTMLVSDVLKNELWKRQASYGKRGCS